MADRESAFAAAKRKREAARADEEAKKAGSGGFDLVAYAPLIKDQYRVFRMLGNPLSVRSLPTDPKLIEQCMIKGDDGKKFRATWPTKEEDPNFVLRRIYDLLSKGKWENPEGEKSYKVYEHKETHKALFNRVMFNDNLDNPYESGWRPSKAVLVNVIDRHDPVYHKDEKHTKILSKKMSVNGENTYFERGITLSLYEKQIWDDVVEFDGDWENYDIVVKKLGKDPWNKAFYGESSELVKYLKAESPETIDLIKKGPLTEEEKAYEMYDLDKIGKSTTYTRIFSKLGSFIKEVDQAFGTAFYEEVLAHKEKEASEKKANSKDQTDKEIKEIQKEVPKSEPVKEEEVVAEEKPAETRPTRQTRTPSTESSTKSPIDWDGLADGSFNGTVYKGVPELTDDEKAQVISVKEDGSFEYVKEWEGESITLYEEENSRFESPGTFSTCPKSGVKF